MPLVGFRAPILSVRDWQAPRYEPDGLLVVEDGIVVARGGFETLAPRYPALATTAFPSKLIVPGFIDAHVHYPQIDRIAAHGEQLLQWLERHIFPAEMAFADRPHADAVAAFFLDQLLRNGTTSALVFATVHEASVDALFEAALERRMRIISGKVLMDLGPKELRDTPDLARTESEALIARWRGRGRLGYAVTPRFALTSSDAQLETAGGLLAAHPDVLLHTHLSENISEIGAVADRFPGAADYLDVYDRFGLVGPRSIFAHGVHLCTRERDRLRESGAGIAHCPTSNAFLGSGLCNIAALTDIKLGLGSDVGAGTTLSLLATMAEAYRVAQLQGHSLDPFRALHFATAGGAELLGIGDRVGALEEGQEADFVVLDPAATPLLARRAQGADLADLLFLLQILGDDRAVFATYIVGEAAWRRSP